MLEARVAAFSLVMVLLACGAPAAPEPASSPVAEVPRAPRHVRAVRGGTTVALGSEPGPLVDGNAPPPVPGTTPYVHPALHGTCTGEPMDCSEAGTIVRAASSLDDAIGGLELVGFDVSDVP